MESLADSNSSFHKIELFYAMHDYGLVEAGVRLNVNSCLQLPIQLLLVCNIEKLRIFTHRRVDRVLNYNYAARETITV